jgi:hypothetical protein
VRAGFIIGGGGKVVAVTRDTQLRCRTVAKRYVIHASSIIQISPLHKSLLGLFVV